MRRSACACGDVVGENVESRDASCSKTLAATQKARRAAADGNDATEDTEEERRAVKFDGTGTTSATALGRARPKSVASLAATRWHVASASASAAERRVDGSR